MSGKAQHDYHLVEPSPWPFVGSMSALVMAIGAVFWMHGTAWGPFVFWAGLAGVLYTMYEWFGDVVRESRKGEHTPVVQIGLRYGMLLFIASEVMFFVAWFWAYFNASLFPTEQMGAVWPPEGIETFDPWHIPFINTLILLLSGTTVTWAHHALIHGDRDGLKKGLAVTVGLGVIFTGFQAYEYAHAAFGMSSGIYGSTFFMATGFHGFHVIVGTVFLAVCLLRANRGHFSTTKHFGFEAAAWYWHFVDVVWIFLFMSIYVWGAGAVAH
ncbi:cytochrome c oxidase subunit 3 [Rhodothalassium salexigens]|uniref:cytochrome c oxidase subunit 3 n=1 Tax=Rhodothalassium salexigens TaxID=1086 RepID=UPI0019123E7E|nr:cytochrome c oxidase subunit 3 [Rhodothalassium salexigens]MBK5912472.1 cytochrome c oxidase subunit 3 [Rhodothalassium salexigens]MBK5920649.1 cytochrome c oxidase subunit 3 [Rhodothalassium salexigens]